MKSLHLFALRFSLVTAMGSIALSGQPVVPAGGAVNVASYAPVGLPNSALAQGALFAIFGSNLGPTQLAHATSFPLQTSLAGTSVQVTSGGTNVSALMIYTSAGQVAAVLPSNTPTGAGTLTVTYNGAASAPIAVEIVSSSFGIFSANQAGSGPGIITDANSILYGPTSAAQPGNVSVIWGTGLGPVQGDEAAGPVPGNQANVPVEIYFGALKVPDDAIQYRGRSGCCAGLDQINVVIPAGVTGCHVPVTVKIGDVVSNSVTVPIASGSATCSDPGGPSSGQLTKFQLQGSASLGYISLNRSTTTTPGLPAPFGNGQPTTSTNDIGSASFDKYTFQQVVTAQNPFQTYTAGACTVFSFKGNSPVSTAPDPAKPVGLDAGAAITVNGPNGAKQLVKNSLAELGPGYYYDALGGGSGPMATPLYLDAGAYTVSGPGGADVGAFMANLNVATPLTWTNENNVNNIQRSAGVGLTWTGGDPNATVQIGGTSFKLGTAPDGSDTVGAVFSCTVPNTGSYTVPSVVLLSLPAGTANPLIPIPTGSLSIGTLSTGSFTATGLDVGTIDSSVTVGKNVTYQ